MPNYSFVLMQVLYYNQTAMVATEKGESGKLRHLTEIWEHYVKEYFNRSFLKIKLVRLN